MGNGETGSKKPHYTQIMKDKIGALEAENAALRASNESLGDATLAPVNTIPAVAAEVVDASPVPDILPVEGADCLASINADVHSVVLVSTMSSIVLRPGNKQSTPTIKRIKSSTDRCQPWPACPWFIGHRMDANEDARLKAQYSHWWHHRITRGLAEAVFDDPRFKRPTETKLGPDEFEGFDSHVWRPIGDLEPIVDFDVLREVVRVALMRVNNTFMEWSARDRFHKFDLRTPNPYRNRLAGVELVSMAALPADAMTRMG